MPRHSSFSAHVLVWLSVPGVEIYLALAGLRHHALWQYGIELLGFGLLALAQWRWAKTHWLGTLLAPGLIVFLMSTTLRTPPDLIGLFFFAAGVALITSSILRDNQEKLRVGALTGVVFGVLANLAALGLALQMQTQDLSDRFGDLAFTLGERYAEQLSWPLHRDALPDEGPGGDPIILISVDTLRADSAAKMEFLQWMKERGAWWPSAMSTSSWTLPAAASIQTGVMPALHGASCSYDTHCQGIHDDTRTIAQELGERGYRTAAITANPWISASTSLSRGFQSFSDYASTMPYRLVFGSLPTGPHEQDAEVLVDAALHWLRGNEARSFYLWLHLIDPHMPYFHTPEFEALNVRSIRGATPASQTRRNAIRSAYEKEVAHTDSQLMRLLRELESQKFFDHGTVIFTSDHGEEFWEHGGVEHGHTHHGVVVEVPLVIVGKGFEAATRSGVASLLDVAPTIRSIAGLPARGNDLREKIAAGRIAGAFGSLVGPLKRSARNESTRTIVTGDAEIEPVHVHRYDLISDPAELVPILGTSEDEVSQSALGIKSPQQGVQLDLNSEALRALGYVE